MSVEESTDCVIVLVTVSSAAEAERIASPLVTEQLAACVNTVGPIRSLYRWEGQLQGEEEFLLLIKTRAALVRQLETRIRALHSYETPEVIALPITAGSSAYLDWLRGATKPATD